MDGHNTYRMDKLVRDSSIRNMTDKGTVVEWRVLDEAETIRELFAKLPEEVGEARAAFEGGDTAELEKELADILEIVRGLALLAGTSLEAVDAVRQATAARRGGFGERLYVGLIHCPVGSFWDDYCARDPEKYPLVR